jgi:hypothetical protein
MDAIKLISNAAKGLYYISETDSPFVVRVMPGSGSIEDRLKDMLNRDPDTSIEKQDLDYFFRNMVKIYEGATAEDELHVKAFIRLKEVLQQSLKNIVVYRLGEINIDAVIAGTTAEGQLITLTTKLVET